MVFSSFLVIVPGSISHHGQHGIDVMVLARDYPLYVLAVFKPPFLPGWATFDIFYLFCKDIFQIG